MNYNTNCISISISILFNFTKNSAKNDARTFLMLGGGGGLERYVMRRGALEGLSWYGIHGLHGLSCPVMLHGMARMEYMSGACHVMA